MAEYNTPCLNLIKKKYLGPSMEMMGQVQEFIKTHKKEMAAQIKKGLWKLSGWEEPVNYIFEGI